MARPTFLCALLAATAHAIRNNANPRPMPRSQPTTLETLLGRDPYNIIDVRGGGVFDDPADEPEEDDVDARMRSGMQKAVAMMRGVGLGRVLRLGPTGLFAS